MDVTPTQAYELFLKDPESFKASAASPDDCLKAFSEASKRANNIFCVTVSTKLSSVYNVALGAKEMAKSELPNACIEVLDSQMATAAEGFIALAAARAAEEGKSLPEVASSARDVMGKVSAIVLLDTIRHVYRSGRIPKIASQVGSVFNIRPILTVAGAVHFKGAARTREHGIERILQMMKAEVGQKRIHVAVMHAYALEEAEKLKERVAAEFNCAEIWLSEFSPLMGYACGTGTLGLAFYPED